MSAATASKPIHTERHAARHASGARTPPWRLTLKFMTRVQWRYLARFPSNHAWMVLRRKYDAFVTDRAYENEPRSWLGPFGRWADRRVLDYPVHLSLRQRLDLVTNELTEAIARRVAQNVRTHRATPVRVLSAPSGLCRDLVQTAARLRDRDPQALAGLDLHCLDIDDAGDVIPEARRRLAAAGVDATFHREDLFTGHELREMVERGEQFHVANCIGLTAWVSIEDVGRLARSFRALLEPGGTLLVDNFAWHEHSAMGADLEIDTVYHPPAEFVSAIEDAGFRIDAALPTANDVCTVYVATAI